MLVCELSNMIAMGSEGQKSALKSAASAMQNKVKDYLKNAGPSTKKKSRTKQIRRMRIIGEDARKVRRE